MDRPTTRGPLRVVSSFIGGVSTMWQAILGVLLITAILVLLLGAVARAVFGRGNEK